MNCQSRIFTTMGTTNGRMKHNRKMNCSRALFTPRINRAATSGTVTASTIQNTVSFKMLATAVPMTGSLKKLWKLASPTKTGGLAASHAVNEWKMAESDG